MDSQDKIDQIIVELQANELTMKEIAKEKGVSTAYVYEVNQGKYGRILGVIIVDGVNVNELMIESHMAVAYEGQSKIDIHKSHMYNRQKLTRDGIKYS